MEWAKAGRLERSSLGGGPVGLCVSGSGVWEAGVGEYCVHAWMGWAEEPCAGRGGVGRAKPGWRSGPSLRQRAAAIRSCNL
jgi:hypothetical protein